MEKGRDVSGGEVIAVSCFLVVILLNARLIFRTEVERNIETLSSLDETIKLG